MQTVGLFEGDVLIATMKLILFSMNCFGRMQTAAADGAGGTPPP